ncbi:MAG: ribonuclease P protein component [Azospira sp.]|nr:ribonuclease P protein component [Azospira sp.]
MSTTPTAADGSATQTVKAGGFGFPRQYRLTGTDEYSSVFGFRRAVKSTHFLLHYRPRAAGEEAGKEAGARLGIVVPKRLLKAAVRRNLVKRIARECFRLLRHRLPAQDLILRLGTRFEALDRKAIAEEISGLLLKLRPAPGPGR